jgi:uncharacterized delta-60 repeat protein
MEEKQYISTNIRNSSKKWSYLTILNHCFWVYFLILILLSSPNQLSAQVSGTLDQTFGNSGIRVSSISTGVDQVYKVHVLPSDKIILTGRSADGYSMARYKTNGMEDLTLGSFGYVANCSPTTTQCTGYSSVLQKDGKIAIAGSSKSTTPNDPYDAGMIRYNADGSIDNTFGNSGFLNIPLTNREDQINSIDIQNDNKIVATGKSKHWFLPYYYADSLFLLRFNPNGTYDNTFAKNGKLLAKLNYSISQGVSVKVLYNQKILVLGEYSGSYYLIQFKSNGTIDTSFGTKGYINMNFYIIQHNLTTARIGQFNVQTDGKILLIGDYEKNQESGIFLFRYNENGSVDSSFGNNGYVETKLYSNGSHGEMFDVIQQKDGKIISCGYAYDNGAGVSAYEFWLITRHLSNGTIDTSFNHSGIVKTTIKNLCNSRAMSIAFQKDEKLIIAGSSVDYQFSMYKKFTVARYNNNYEKLNLTIKNSTADSFKIPAYITDSVSNLRKNIAKLLNVNEGCFKLYKSATELTDAKTLGYYQISNSSTLQIVMNLPKPTIQQISNNTLKSSSATGNQWYNPAGIISGATYQTYFITVSDTYWVKVTQSPCFSLSDKGYHMHIDNIKEIEYPLTIETYPNPSNGLINIRIGNAYLRKYELVITDLNGKIIFSKSNQSASNEESINFNAQSGIYILTLCNDNRIFRRKLVIN